LLNEAELEAEIASVKKRLTARQLANLTENIDDSVPGNVYTAVLLGVPVSE